MLRDASGRVFRRVAVAVLVIGAVAIGPPAHADSPNSISAFIQPMSGCQVGRTGALYCEGVLGSPSPIAADTASNPPLWSNTGYALCWTTTSGATLPSGATCSASGTAIATGNNFAYTTTASFPATFTGAGGSGCTAYPNNNANSFFFFVTSPGACAISITTPEAPGFTATTTTFTLTAVPAPLPAIRGTITAAAGTFRSGDSAPLQRITCQYDSNLSIWTPCPGVVLKWTVTSGKKSCAIRLNRDRKSRLLGTVSVVFRTPGTCTVQATYPEVPGRSLAYTSPTYSFTVKKGN